MPRRASAKRYAQAAFELAFQQDQVEGWAQQLGTINEALQSTELRAFLEHAKVPLARKVETVEQALPDVDPLVRNLLSLLVSRGLVDLFSELVEDYGHMLNEYRGREEVEVQSAVPLEQTERERVAQFLTSSTGKEVVLDTTVDPDILGGLVIRVGDRLIDGSTRTRLGQLAKQLRIDSAVATT
jgi:F-type H+-transporting ATPase subunit delta